MTTDRSWRPRLLLRLAGGVLLWWILTGGGPSTWLIGGLTIALVLVLPAPPLHSSWRLSLPGLVRFIPYFLLQSLRGGLDVARRAFSPRLPLHPALLEYPLSLPPGSARIFLLNSVSLLPGTLSADLQDDCLLVHVLDQQLDPQLEQLEEHVAALFALPAGGAHG
ncbi:MAG: Na+/H+ antiporter subunit E [Pelovirga sp.]